MAAIVRVRVPDTRAPGFREETRRQAALLRGAPEEAEAVDFIEAAAIDLLDRPRTSSPCVAAGVVPLSEACDEG